MEQAIAAIQAILAGGVISMSAFIIFSRLFTSKN